jgi:hypothetical protein
MGFAIDFIFAVWRHLRFADSTFDMVFSYSAL